MPKPLAIAIVAVLLVTVGFVGCIGREPPDRDGDGIPDDRDIDPDVDVIVAITFTKIRIEDDIDPWPSEEGEIYLKVSAKSGWFDKEVASSPIYYEDNENRLIFLNYTFIYNVPDDKEEVEFTFTVFDDDLGDDKLDISGGSQLIGNKKACEIKYNILSHTWTGDTETNVTSGNDDGSTDKDEDDATVWFEIVDSLGKEKELAEVLGYTANLQGYNVTEVDVLNEYYNDLINEIESEFKSELIDETLSFFEEHPDLVPFIAKYGRNIQTAYTIYGIIIYFYSNIYLGNNNL